MTQPTSFAGRPLTPAPGAPTPERKVARVRGHARRLVWPALVLIAVSGAVGYYWDNLPAPFETWMLPTAAAAVVLLLVVMPFFTWLSRTYTITTRRVIARSGLLTTHRSELPHARGYSIRERRGPLQRLWGSGTLILSNGVDAPLVMKNIPAVMLVHEVLADQVEVSQILAHRDSHAIPTVGDPGPPPPLPGR
ncbi:PH domain-containing protein [Microbacterium sp. zg.Y1090]|uniref:PH domain-containing protein n=1 Tax=Microbacterium TaxID=33882 RepID=UPI00214BAE2A|nr:MULTISPECIES: PH domain-containing protein [unclassified Microbacterium]MCR2813619.1 PH domain-containing protein [Microbacterium sp. zg.Y1084]MCR2818048.1 PH domain-containing protein [Microbacterium sp. zg.Y1090]MDL5486566.1 PH domain-containing protein [Microbacterium sp. zg-Y1211]WIM27793.1 PH domain-containing protein [Microbacterium sp. zg-Y1090]